MPRRPSRLFAALLWLAIALLPLRGIAAVWMHGEPAASPAVTTTQVEHPCHGAAMGHADAAVDGASADTVLVQHGCQLCDLCHSGVAAAPDAPMVAQGLPAAPPAAPFLSPQGRTAPDGLFRPPR